MGQKPTMFLNDLEVDQMLQMVIELEVIHVLFPLPLVVVQPAMLMNFSFPIEISIKTEGR